jgi:hypothetical protein
MPKLEIGSKVRHLGRAGFVTGQRLPDARCVGGKLLAIGERCMTRHESFGIRS